MHGVEPHSLSRIGCDRLPWLPPVQLVGGQTGENRSCSRILRSQQSTQKRDPHSLGGPGKPLPCGEMASWLRRAVSQQKRRLTEPGFDLDLSYIVEDPRRGNVIAMGVPVSGRSAEGVPSPLVPACSQTSNGHQTAGFAMFANHSLQACNPG